MFLSVHPSYSEELNVRHADALSRQVIKLHHQGNFADAVPLAETALVIKRKVLGSRHPDVAQCLNLLAVLHKSLGHYREAEPLFKEALVINRTALGPDHSRVGLIQNNLANLYSFLGDYTRAESLYRDALLTFEKSFGKDHPRVAKTSNNLGMLYYATGDYTRAEYSLQKALSAAERALGPDDPVVDLILSNLAGLHKSIGKDAQAERLQGGGAELKKAVPVKTGPEGPPEEDVNEERVPGRPMMIPKEITEPAMAVEVLKPQEGQRGEDKAAEENRVIRASPWGYVLYLGSFRTLRLAERAVGIYRERGLSPYRVKVDLGKKGIWFRVVTGHFPDRKLAETFKREHDLLEASIKPARYAGAPGIVKEPEGTGGIETGPGQPKKLSYPYSLYLGSFQNVERAERAITHYRGNVLSPYRVKVNLTNKGTWHRVYTGCFPDRSQAETFKVEYGLKEAVVKNTRFANLIGYYAPSDLIEDKIRELKKLGYSPYRISEEQEGRSRLYVGAFHTREGALRQYNDLASHQIQSQVVQR